MRVIFDLDGTLANIEHRLPHISDKKNSDWDAFHMSCGEDALITEVAAIYYSLRDSRLPRHEIQIWSGRSDMVYNQTSEWLYDHGLTPDLIRMREHGDYTVDHQLKESWLKRSIAKGWIPDIVFDDRKQVVDMWRRNGIRCCQVAPGEF